MDYRRRSEWCGGASLRGDFIACHTSSLGRKCANRAGSAKQFQVQNVFGQGVGDIHRLDKKETKKNCHRLSEVLGDWRNDSLAF